MKEEISKSEAENKINEFFLDIINKTPKEIDKIKKLAMTKKTKLKEKRKFFCKYCSFPYKNSKIKIKNKMKSVTCQNCGKINRWKIE